MALNALQQQILSEELNREQLAMNDPVQQPDGSLAPPGPDQQRIHTKNVEQIQAQLGNRRGSSGPIASSIDFSGSGIEGLDTAPVAKTTSGIDFTGSGIEGLDKKALPSANPVIDFTGSGLEDQTKGEDVPATGKRPNDVLSVVQGALSGVGSLVEPLAAGAGGIVGAWSGILGGRESAGDPIIKAGMDAGHWLKNAVLSEEDQKQGNLANKIEEGLGGIAPMAAFGPAMPLAMGVAGGWEQGKALLDQGADLRQSQEGAALGFGTGYMFRFLPGVMQGGGVAGQVALGGGLNVAAGGLQDAIVKNVILNDTQPEIKKQYEQSWNKSFERFAVGAVTGGVMKKISDVHEGIIENRNKRVQEASTDEVRDILSRAMPEALPKFKAPKGTPIADYIYGRLQKGDATTLEIFDLVRQDHENTTAFERELLGDLVSLGRHIGLDTSTMMHQEGNTFASLNNTGFDFAKISQRQLSKDMYYHIIHEGTHAATAGALHWAEAVKADIANKKMKMADLSSEQKNIMDRVGKLEEVYKKTGEALGKTVDAKFQTIPWEMQDAQGNVIKKQGAKDFKEIRQLLEFISINQQHTKGTIQLEFFDQYYGLKNSREHVAELFSNQQYRDLLAKHRDNTPTSKGVSEFPNLWVKAKQAIKAIIEAAGGYYNKTLLSAGMDHAMRLIEETGAGTRKPAQTERNLKGAEPQPSWYQDKNGAWDTKDKYNRTIDGEAQYLKAKAEYVRDKPKWEASMAKSAKIAKKRAEQLEEAKKVSGIPAAILQRVAFLRSQAHTKEEFAQRMSAEIPTDSWKQLTKDWVDRIWNDPYHFSEIAGKAKQESGIMSTWVKSTPFLDDFLKHLIPNQLGPDGEVIQRIHPADDMNRRGSQWQNPQTIKLMNSEGVAGKIMKWVYDRTPEYRAIRDIAYETSKAHMKKFNELDRKSQFKLLDAISEFQSGVARRKLEKAEQRWIPDSELTKRGLSQTEIEAYHGLSQGTEYLWSMIQQARSKMGLEPLPFMPAYMPHIWVGPYKVFIRSFKKLDLSDKGPVIEVKTFRFRQQAEAYAKALQSGKHDDPNAQFFLRPQKDEMTREFYSVHKFKESSSFVSGTMNEHLQAYQQMLLLDPKALAMLERIDDDAMRGMSKHMLERDDVKGWVGQNGSEYMQKWQNKVSGGHWLTQEQNNMLLLYQNYAKGVSKFYSNVLYMDEVISPLLDTQKPANSNRTFYGQLMGETEGMLSKQIKEYAANFTGENLNNLPWVDRYIQDASIRIGVDPLLYRKVVRELKNALSTTKLKVNPGNYVANVFQPLNTLSILTLFNSQVKSEGVKSIPSSIVSMMKGLKGMTDPNAEQMAVLQWAKEQHLAQPQLANELKLRGLGTGIEKEPSKLNPLNWNENIEGFGRKLSLLTAYEHMKGVYGDPARAREAASMVMEMTMVNYDRTERPLMYQNYGVLGELISPFAVFRNAYIGNTLLTYKHLKENPTKVSGWAPLIMMQATYLGLAGTLGMVGASEYDAIIDLIRQQFPEMDTPPKMGELMRQGKIPDAVAYGVISAASGVHLSASMNAVSADDSLSPAMVDFVTAIGKIGILTAKEGAIKAGAPLAVSSKDWQGPINQLMPSLGKPWYNQHISGSSTIKPMATSGEAVVEMSPQQRMVENIMGKPELGIRKEMDVIQSDRETDRTNAKVAKQMVQIAVDKMKGKSNKIEVEEAYARWREITTGDPTKFQEAIKQTLEGTYTPYIERIARKNEASSKQRLEKILDSLGRGKY